MLTDAHGRPSNERDGACICDYNPSTTDGPQEDCPFHGRPYAYWIERGDALAERLAEVSALADAWQQIADRRLPHDGCFDMYRHLSAELRALIPLT